MLDLSPHITIPKNQKVLYRCIQVLLIVFFIFLSGLFLLRLILPVIVFTHNIPNTDPLYRLTSPETIHDTVEFNAALRQDIDHIVLTIIPQNNAQNLAAKEVSVTKTYKALRLPLESSAPILTQKKDAPFPAGALIRSNTEYFIIDTEKKYAISNKEILLAAGYEFTDGKDTTSSQRAFYKNGSKFHMKDMHPVGTQFYDEASNTYLVRSESALHTTTQNKNLPTIIANRESAQDKVSCKLKKKFLRNAYSCNLSLEAVSAYPGKDYIFALKNTEANDIKSVSAKFSLQPSQQNIQSRIGLIKEVLLK